MSLHNFKTNGKSHWGVLLNTALFFDLELMMSFPLKIFLLESWFENRLQDENFKKLLSSRFL